MFIPPGNPGDLPFVKAIINRALSSLNNRVNRLDRGQGEIRLSKAMNANGFPIKNLPNPQRDPSNAITKSEASSLVLSADVEGTSLLWAYFLSG